MFSKNFGSVILLQVLSYIFVWLSWFFSFISPQKRKTKIYLILLLFNSVNGWKMKKKQESKESGNILKGTIVDNTNEKNFWYFLHINRIQIYYMNSSLLTANLWLFWSFLPISNLVPPNTSSLFSRSFQSTEFLIQPKPLKFYSNSKQLFHSTFYKLLYITLLFSPIHLY